MKNLSWVTPIVLSSTLILPACDKKEDNQVPGSTNPSTTSAPSTPAAKLSDSDLEKAIRAKLESDDALKQAKLSVNADAKDNKATISGTVVSQDLRNKAVDLAKSAQPGVTIEDKIDVKPAA
jgi:osmotically-inducible protein OsmY